MPEDIVVIYTSFQSEVVITLDESIQPEVTVQTSLQSEIEF